MLDHRERNAEVDCQSGMEKLANDVVDADVVPDDGSKPDSAFSATATIEEAPLRTGRWTPDEKILFLYGLKRFGKGRWKKMSVYLPHR
jgi:Myb-like DNA-binding domain